MNIQFFWDVMLCHCMYSSKGSQYLHFQVKAIQNCLNLKMNTWKSSNYTTSAAASHPRTGSSVTPLWQSQMSHFSGIFTTSVCLSVTTQDLWNTFSQNIY